MFLGIGPNPKRKPKRRAGVMPNGWQSTHWKNVEASDRFILDMEQAGMSRPHQPKHRADVTTSLAEATA